MLILKGVFCNITKWRILQQHHTFLWDVIPWPYPNFNGDLTKARRCKLDYE